MNYKTHVNGGILMGLYVTSQIQTMDLTSTILFVGGSAMGSLLPDIDHKKSYIGQRAKPVSSMINKFAGHRKLFHAPLMYLLIYSFTISNIANYHGQTIMKGLFAGILSHLILDSFTVGGLPWFFPLSKKKFSFSKIKTNSKKEDIIYGILTCVNVIVILDLLNIISIVHIINKVV